jgi:TolA-binding protein
MKRRHLVGVSLIVLALAPGHAQETQILKPFVIDDEGRPIPRAEPVKPAPPANRGVATPAAGRPGPAAPPVAAATPVPKAATPPPLPEPEEPGTIRFGPAGTPRTAEQLQIDVANGYYAKKMYDLAAPEYEKYLSLYPAGEQRPEALFRLAESYRNNGTMNAARNVYETLLVQYKVGDFIGPASYRLADIYYGDKQYREALELYRRASVRLKRPSDVNLAKFFAARCLEALGQKMDARIAYEDLTASNENNPFQDASRLSLALLLKDANRTPEALKQIQMLAVKAENADVKLQATVYAGQWSLELNPPQTAQAEAAFRKAVEMPGPARWKEMAQVGLLKIAFEGGKYQQVIDTFNQPGAQFSPELRPELLIVVAKAYQQLNNTAESSRYFDQVIRDYANSVYAKEAQFEKLRMLHLANDPGLLGAIDQYLAVNPEAEKRDLVLLMKGEFFFRKGDYANAAPIYSALELSRQLPGAMRAEALFKLGWCQMELQALDKASNAFTAFIDGYPTHKLIPAALLQRAIAWQKQKNLGAALADYNDIIRKYPQAKEREFALEQKAMILGDQGDNAGMAEAFKLLLKDYPKTTARPKACYWIGLVAYEAKNYKEAIPYLEEARKLDKEKNGEKASIRLLLCYYYLEDFTGTAREVDYYSKEGKTQVPAEVLRSLGTELSKRKAYDSAEKYLLLLKVRDEVVPDDFLLLGRTQQEMNKHQEATDSFQHYLKVVKGPAVRANGLLLLGNSQIQLKALDAAQKSVDEASTLQPEGEINGEARIAAGDIQMARGKFEEAAKLYETVYATGIDHPEITPRSLTKSIAAYRAAGNEEKVKKLLNILQSRYPEYFQKNKAALQNLYPEYFQKNKTP